MRQQTLRIEVGYCNTASTPQWYMYQTLCHALFRVKLLIWYVKESGQFVAKSTFR